MFSYDLYYAFIELGREFEFGISRFSAVSRCIYLQ
jgi:hypothetical protein